MGLQVGHPLPSTLRLTRWSSPPRVACRRCGARQQLTHRFHSLLPGSWGVPRELPMTPAQTVRNLAGLLQPAGARAPSPRFRRLLRRGLAGQALAQEHQGAS